MQEIIASISRIIDEDSRTPHAPRQSAGAGSDEIFELTEVIETDGSVRKLTGASSSGAEQLSQPQAVADEAVAPAVSGVGPETMANSDPPRDPVLSPVASEAAVAAFSRLGTVPLERRIEPGPSLGAADRTLEQIVRDTLHPLLRAWLDEHLPVIVERLVREEIQRVVREAGLR